MNKYIIEICGLSNVLFMKNGDVLNVDDFDYKLLNDYGSDANFVNYIDDKSLANKLVEGYMCFKSGAEGKELFTITKYYVKENETLSLEEIDKLIDYTVGQWSDGVGEGFEQILFEVKDLQLYISPWFHGQKQFLTLQKV